MAIVFHRHEAWNQYAFIESIASTVREEVLHWFLQHRNRCPKLGIHGTLMQSQIDLDGREAMGKALNTRRQKRPEKI